MKNLLTLEYWFNLRPETLIPVAQKTFLGFIAALAVFALIASLIKKKSGIYRGFVKRLHSFCLTNTVIGIILFFFNYEVVPFFSARFWLGLWALIMIIWMFFILKNLSKVPHAKKQLEQQSELKKYLP